VLALVQSKGLAIREVPEPVPRPGEVRVRVLAAGICNTDLEIARGYMGFEGTLGHELAGVVEDGELAGTRVVSEINLACGACELCARGLGRHCPTRTVLGILGKDGCFADVVTLPRRNLHPVADRVDPAALVFVEPLAAAYEILEQVHVEPGMRALVLGDGKLGLLAAFVLARAGAITVVAGRHEHKLAIARAYGAQPAKTDEISGRGFDLVVEATGQKRGLARALELVNPRGTVVLKSTFFGSTELDAAKIVIDEIRVVGSRCGPFAPAIAAIESGAFDPRPLISASYALRDGVQALEEAARPGVLKVILRPG
jgi:threonine dehydrogenase-like Zn-dependent dehydrogenase